MNDILNWLFEVVQSVDVTARVIIAGVAIMLETSVLVGLIVPGDTIVLIAATAVDSVTEGLWLGVAVVTGAIIGESIGFWLGVWLGPRLRRSWAGKKIGEHNWVRAETLLRRRGGIAIFVSRFLPVLHSLVPLTVGMSGFAYRRFLLWTLPACVVWAGIYVPVGALAGGTYRALADQAHWAGYLFVGVIVLFLGSIALAKHLLVRKTDESIEARPKAREDVL